MPGSVSIHMLLTEQYLEYPLVQSMWQQRPAWSGQVVSRDCNQGYIVHLLDTRMKYRQVSNIRRILIGNNIVDHSDVVGASPVGAAPTTSSFST